MKKMIISSLWTLLIVTGLTGCATHHEPNGTVASQGCAVKDNKLVDSTGKPMSGCVMMRNGKMMVMNGTLGPMKKNMTMPMAPFAWSMGTA